ncbi:MAG: hypothetical protein HQL17_02675 [Candidatus Omnitrophica bacterium]|nr:hypothetical protein [Candidatus Omnitrophota bacterium]
MKEFLEYMENHRITAIMMVVGALVVFALFSVRQDAAQTSAMCLNGACRQGALYNPQPTYAPQQGYAPQPRYMPPVAYGAQPRYGAQPMPQNNCLMYPSAPGCPMAAPVMPMQQVALPAGTITLAMGVVLEGKGTVVTVERGSAAERAGIQPGDLINRINGR